MKREIEIHLRGELKLDDACFQSDAIFRKSSAGVSLKGTRFLGDVKFDQIQIQGAISGSGAEFRGHLIISNARTPEALALPNSNFMSSVSFADCNFGSKIDLSGSRFAADFTIEGGNLPQRFDLSDS